MAWLTARGAEGRTGPPIRWIALAGTEQEQRLARWALANEGTAVATPGTPAATKATKAMGITVTSVARITYRTTDDGRMPRTAAELAEDAILVMGAEAIGRDQVGDLLATGMRVLLATTGAASQDGFLHGRKPDFDAAKPSRQDGTTVLGTKALRVATRRLADGTLELVCMEDDQTMGISRNDVFRRHPR